MPPSTPDRNASPLVTGQIDLLATRRRAQQQLSVRCQAATDLLSQGRFQEAEKALREILQERPGHAASRKALATLLFRVHRWRESADLFGELVREFPDHAGLHADHAAALAGNRQTQKAREAMETVLRRWPDLSNNRLHLAALLRRDLFRPCDALAVLEAGLATEPDNAALHFGRGRALQDLLDIPGALRAYQRAFEIDPVHRTSLSAHQFCHHYLPRPDPAVLHRMSTQHGHLLQDTLPPKPPVPAAKPPGARLRVGLVSGDLGLHPVSHFLEAVFTALTRRPVDLLVYDTHPRQDDLSMRLRAQASVWREVEVLTDDQLCDTIRADRADVLLDLSGYTNHHRLGAFLRRAAPLQVGWLGYFATTGLPAMDAVIADPHCVPDEERRFFSERVLFMPHSRLCMTPPALAPEVAPEPPLSGGAGMRFACFQNLLKINERVLDAWRRILAGAPDATLLIQSRYVNRPQTMEAFVRRLAHSGIDLARVHARDASQRHLYLAQYAEVDVLLDTFPYPGGTTTAEAIWMGVPTLSLATPGMLGRQGQALLEAVGLGDWVVHSDDAYVARALALTQDRTGSLERLRALRRTLRDTARCSPLFDAERFACDFEALLRQACQDAADGRFART
jgi:protein O-GlcNAc transferase